MHNKPCFLQFVGNFTSIYQIPQKITKTTMFLFWYL